jgi:hypothetical protein
MGGVWGGGFLFAVIQRARAHFLREGFFHGARPDEHAGKHGKEEADGNDSIDADAANFTENVFNHFSKTGFNHK